jgi:ABC-type glycerol-3-phosphate transport system permease component
LIYIGTLKGLSKSYTEAAYIDGATEMQILMKIIVPLVRNVFLTIALIYFIGYWNDTTTVLVYLPGYPTFAYGVWYNVFVSTTPDMNKTTLKMTAAMFMIIPILIVFMIFRKRLMSNLSTGGVKE